jgi:hypothetical protein
LTRTRKKAGKVLKERAGKETLIVIIAVLVKTSMTIPVYAGT